MHRVVPSCAGHKADLFAGQTSWAGMLDGTSRPTNPEYEPGGFHQEGGTASPGCDEPDPATSRLSLSFLVKQPGGLGLRLQNAPHASAPSTDP